MKKVTITRNIKAGDDGIFGILQVDDFTCKTGELPWRNNEKGKSCIPAGTYIAKIFQSPKFGKVYKLEGTEPRTFVLIHSGNFSGNVDKGKKSDVEGCILLGQKLGVINNQKVVQSSKWAVTHFMNVTNGEDLEIEIKEEFDENI